MLVCHSSKNISKWNQKAVAALKDPSISQPFRNLMRRSKFAQVPPPPLDHSRSVKATGRAFVIARKSTHVGRDRKHVVASRTHHSLRPYNYSFGSSCVRSKMTKGTDIVCAERRNLAELCWLLCAKWPGPAMPRDSWLQGGGGFVKSTWTR